MRLLFALLGLTLAANSAHPQGKELPTVQGRVLLDNGNGKVDGDDKGLAGVLVTDGVQFVRTAAGGSFTLTVADDPVIPQRASQVISVTWPSGTWPVRQHWYARLSDVKPGAKHRLFTARGQAEVAFYRGTRHRSAQ